MRISDWSSDVCSSDLRIGGLRQVELQQARQHGGAGDLRENGLEQAVADHDLEHRQRGRRLQQAQQLGPDALAGELCQPWRQRAGDGKGVGVGRRSEEHTSELQSLMRISYAVFCLKKKN